MLLLDPVPDTRKYDGAKRHCEAEHDRGLQISRRPHGCAY